MRMNSWWMALLRGACFLFVLHAMPAQSQAQEDWQNEAVFGIGRTTRRHASLSER
jgi:hypothetical protein